MDLNEYQKLAARTMNHALADWQQEMHALHGMVGELGELHSIYQKVYNSHDFSEYHAKRELGDLLWFIAEYCTAHGWKLEDICKMNLEKMDARYPDGFDPYRSLHRDEKDI